MYKHAQKLSKISLLGQLGFQGFTYLGSFLLHGDPDHVVVLPGLLWLYSEEARESQAIA